MPKDIAPPAFQLNDLIEHKEFRGKRKWRVVYVFDMDGTICTLQRLKKNGEPNEGEPQWTGNLKQNGYILLHRPASKPDVAPTNE